MPPKKELFAHRNLIIARIQEIYELAQNITTDASLSTLFTIKYRTLNTLYEEFNTLHVQILILTSESEFAEQEAIRKTVDMQYFDTVSIYERRFPVVATSPTLGSDSAPTSNLEQNARLPKLELPKFAGEVKAWQTFIDLFNSLVHNQSSLDPIETTICCCLCRMKLYR